MKMENNINGYIVPGSDFDLIDPIYIGLHNERFSEIVESHIQSEPKFKYLRNLKAHELKDHDWQTFLDGLIDEAKSLKSDFHQGKLATALGTMDAEVDRRYDQLTKEKTSS
jgi:hypothetical protein